VLAGNAQPGWNQLSSESNVRSITVTQFLREMKQVDKEMLTEEMMALTETE
jgi:hypothetical protein